MPEDVFSDSESFPLPARFLVCNALSLIIAWHSFACLLNSSSCVQECACLSGGFAHCAGVGYAGATCTGAGCGSEMPVAACAGMVGYILRLITQNSTLGRKWRIRRIEGQAGRCVLHRPVFCPGLLSRTPKRPPLLCRSSERQSQGMPHGLHDLSTVHSSTRSNALYSKSHLFFFGCRAVS